MSPARQRRSDNRNASGRQRAPGRPAASDLGDGAARQVLIQAAARRFALQGADGTRLREIVDDAGMTPAMVAYYFQDKSGLLEAVVREALEAVVLMLQPMTPHICHALWQQLGHATPLIDQGWPQVDESALELDTVELVVQVNGKLRGKISVAADAAKDAIEEAALADDNVQRFVDGKPIRKVIVVPGRLVNIVV